MLSPLEKIDTIVRALSAGQTCPAELNDQIIEITGYSLEDLKTMSVAQILGLAASWLALRTDRLDRALAVAASTDTAEKLRLLIQILVQLKENPGDANRATRFAVLQPTYPHLQLATLKSIEESTLYFEIALPKQFRRSNYETKLKQWNTLLETLLQNGISVSESQKVDAYKYLFASKRYKPTEVLKILGVDPQSINYPKLTEACKALQGIKPLQYLCYLRETKDLDARFLTGAAYPLLKQEILEAHEKDGIDNLLVFGANAWFTSVWFSDARLNSIPTTYILPDICAPQAELLAYACQMDHNNMAAKVAFENNFYQDEVPFSAHTAVILFAAAGYPFPNHEILSKIQKKCQGFSVPLYIVSGTAEYLTSTSIFSILKSEYTSVRSVVIFPQDFPDSDYPRRKQLICASISDIPIPHQRTIDLIRLNKIIREDTYYLTSPRLYEPVISIEYERFLENHSETLRSIYATEMRSGETRNTAFRFQLSPELVISYRIQSHNNADQLVCTFLAPKQGNSVSGKRLKITEKRKMITTKDDPIQWLNHEYPMMPIGRSNSSQRIIDIVRDAFEALLPKARQNISYKTVAFFFSKEIMEGKNTREEEQIWALMDTDVGQISVSTSQAIVDTVLLNTFENNAQRSRALNTLIEISKIAVQKGYISECPLRPYPKVSKNKELAEIRNALSKKAFTTAEMQIVLEETINAIQCSSPMYVCTLIRIFTGLEPATVATLRWSDFRRNDVFDFYQLYVERQWSPNPGATIGFSSAKSYRIIPVAPILEAVLTRMKSHSTEDGLIVAHPDGSGLSPTEIKKLDKEIILHISQEGRTIFVPNEDGDTVEIDLANYSGDFIRTNADYWFGKIGLTEDELKYLLGLYPQTTFGRKYCDFAAPETQYVMFRKMSRWNPGANYRYPAQGRQSVIQMQTPLLLPAQDQTVVSVSGVLANAHDENLQLQVTCSGGASLIISELREVYDT